MSRNGTLAAVFVLIGLPVVVVPITAASWFSANADNGAFVSSGLKREYLLYVPASYDRSRRTPLVISLHGGGLWGAAHRDMSQWNAVADREGLIVVYPSGLGGQGVRSWGAVEDGLDQIRDVTFISELIDTLAAHYTIDPARIYANGLSNGGGMTFVLSCKLSDRLAAVGLVASAHLLPFKWCTDRRPIPMINFHGTADPAVPYTGGTTWVAPGQKHFPNQLTWTANWARRNGCAATPRDSMIAADVTRRAYVNCAKGADVELYTIQGGGHTWPGGGPQPEWFVGRTSHSIDASSVMWAFFREHPLVRR
ncbi:MAG: PHB depolymerase family esterase [Gemmatimonadota bacterium]